MYQKHPEFTEPNKFETEVWRYLKFDRFVSLLENRALYFASIKNLQEMDPREGISPPANREAYLRAVKISNSNQKFSFDESQQILKATTSYYEGFSGITSTVLPYRVANCWHVNELESEVMWDQYGDIAIRTTFKRLTESFNKSEKKLYYSKNNVIDKEVPVYAGLVRYINRNEQWINYNPFSFDVVLHKERQIFQQEQELRVVADFSPIYFGLPLHYSSISEYFPDEGIPELLRNLVAMNGIFIPVDLETLIDTVFISPFAETHLKSKVEEVILKANIKANVELSQLKK